MDFEKIRYFLVLADTLSYTKASQQLYISQSMLSRHIMALEQELGMPLFTRNSHGVSLTPVGNYLRIGLKNINNEYELLLRQAHVINQGLSGELRISSIEMLGLSAIQSYLTKYERLHPDLKIILSSSRSPNEMCMDIVRGNYDFGLGMRINKIFPSLSSMQVGTYQICLVMLRQHPLAGRPADSLNLSDFKDDVFITPVDSISTAYTRLVERCVGVGFMPNVITVPNIMSVGLWLEMNRGVSFLHSNSLMRSNPSLVFHTLQDIESDEPFNLYWNAENLTPQATAFLDYLRQELPQSD